MKHTDRVKQTFDNLITTINTILDDFAVAYTYHDLGKKYICSIDDETEVFPEFYIGSDIHVEWPSISDVKLFNDNYPSFLVEVFHSRLAQSWQNCLNDIFSIFIDSHFSAERPFIELKKRQVRLDFSSSDSILTQIRNVCIDDFDFMNYPDKIKIIKNTLNSIDLDSYFKTIYKNMLIRNNIQHSNGIVDDKLLKSLGEPAVEILDKDGINKYYKNGDKIELSYPELYLFGHSIIYVIQKWRENNEHN